MGLVSAAGCYDAADAAALKPSTVGALICRAPLPGQTCVRLSVSQSAAHSTCELASEGGSDSGLGVLAPEGGRRAGEGGSEPAPEAGSMP